MKINRKELLTALKIASKVVETKSNMPILQSVLLDPVGQRILATDLEIGMSYPIVMTDFEKVEVSDPPDEDLLDGLKKKDLLSLNEDYGIVPDLKDGKLPAIRAALMTKLNAESTKQYTEQFCLSAKRLLKVVESESTEEVEITVVGKTGLFGYGQVRVGEYFQNLPTLAAEEFPTFDVTEDTTEGNENWVEINKDKLAKVLTATANENEGWNLGVIYFDKDHAVATDGHRMHRVGAIVEGKSWCLGAKEAKTLISITPKHEGTGENMISYPIKLVHGEKNIHTKIGKADIILRPRETKFPDYLSFVETAPAHEIKIKKGDIVPILNRATLMLSDNYKGVKLTFNGKIDIEMINPDAGSYVHQGAVECEGEVPDPVEVGLDLKYISDIMKASDHDDIAVGVTDHEHPILFSQEGFFGLIMPMRI